MAQLFPRVIVAFSSFFAVCTCFLTPAQAQDNPMFDTPVVDPQQKSTIVIPNLTVITTDDGFDNFDLGVDNAEPHMAVNPLNPLWYFNAYNTNAAHHTENGHDWTSTSPAFGFPMRGDPVIAYDSLGNLYYENMYGSPSILGCKVLVSTNNGNSWTTSAGVTSVAGVDKNWIAADQTMGPYANYVYTTMTAGSGNGNFSRSTDQGVTWQSTASFGTQVLPGMMVAVGPDVLGGNNVSGGAVYVVTHSGSNGAGTYSFYVSSNGGVTFTLKSQQTFSNYIGIEIGGRSTVNGMRTRPYPFIAADNSFGPYRGRLYLVYASNMPVGNGNRPDVFCRYSTDQGATWSAAVTINDDVNTINNHNFMPATWCDKETGRLYVKWYDSRRDPGADSVDVYASYSEDGGVTWEPNQRITNKKFRINYTGTSGPNYQGDYDAITSTEYGALSAWTDFRNRNRGSMVAYFPDYAMKVYPSADTSGVTDSLDAIVAIPDVRLYDKVVHFTGNVSPSANFTISFPQGDSLTAFPDSLPMRISWSGVPSGNYTITVTGTGPGGMPVHKRTIGIVATAPFVALVQPNGGEQIFGATSYPIMWNLALVDSVKLEYSTNGGSSWTLIASGLPGAMNDNLSPKEKALVARGGSATSVTSVSSYLWQVPETYSTNCLVRVSDNANSSINDVSNATFSIVQSPAAWINQASPSASDLYSVAVVDTSRAFAAGAGGLVMRTVNGGTSWFTTIGQVTDDVYCIDAIDQLRAFVGTHSSTGVARIRRTQNSGLTWSIVYEDSSAGAFIDAIKMFDLNNGYAVGDPVGGQWTLLRTTDGGATWNQAATLAQSGSETGWNNSMSWIGDSLGWFGTNNSRVYYTTDGGASWSPGATSFANSYGVSFANSLLGMTGAPPTAVSSNGGVTWANTASQPGGQVSGIAGLDLVPPRFYVSSGSQIHKTEDKGVTYLPDHAISGTTAHLAMKIVPIDGLDWIVGYAVGTGGSISKYIELDVITTTGETGGSPLEFSLSQNYPNPFNPVTQISYGIPQQSLVRISIYDVLGREVALLQDDNQPAGYHSVTWKGAASSGAFVASGMYFYRIDATGTNGSRFTSMKKMMLLK